MKINRDLTTTALLSVLILLSGAAKIPSPIAGGEFQLSAPIAVLICACFGFKKYITAGFIASILGMMLGTSTILNVLIAMTFRIVAGGSIALFGAHWPVVVISGPVGSLAARVLLAQITGVSWTLLAAAALPGMIFTAVATGILYHPCRKLLHRFVPAAIK